MRTELVAKRYCTEVTVEEMHRIIDRDGTRQSLFAALFATRGVNEIEYGGHFGPYVWYTIDALEDTEQTHKAIEKAITNAARK